MTVAGNSIVAYYQDYDRLNALQLDVLRIVHEATMPSSRDISRLLQRDRTSITGRIKELEEKQLIKIGGTKIDPFTKKTVNWYQPTRAI